MSDDTKPHTAFSSQQNEARGLSKDGLATIQEQIRTVYSADDRPWVIGYSGGKDSTTALQLIWYSLAELPPEKRKKTVHVIASDTLVETPVIVD